MARAHAVDDECVCHVCCDRWRARQRPRVASRSGTPCPKPATTVPDCVRHRHPEERQVAASMLSIVATAVSTSPDMHRRRIGDRVVDRDRHVLAAYSQANASALSASEIHDAAVRHAKPVHHVGAHRHPERGRVRRNLHDLDAEPPAERIVRQHAGDDAARRGDCVVAHAKNLPFSRAMRRSSGLGR